MNVNKILTAALPTVVGGVLLGLLFYYAGSQPGVSQAKAGFTGTAA